MTLIYVRTFGSLRAYISVSFLNNTGSYTVQYNKSVIVPKLTAGLQDVANKWLEIGTLLGITMDKLLGFKEQCSEDGLPISQTCLEMVIKVC